MRSEADTLVRSEEREPKPEPEPELTSSEVPVSDLADRFRLEQTRWQRADSAHELLQKVLAGTAKMPILSLTVRLADGSIGKMDIDSNTWQKDIRDDLARAMLDGIAAEWQMSLAEVVKSGSRLHAIYQ